LPPQTCRLDDERREGLRASIGDDTFLEMSRPFVPFDPLADPDGFPLCLISKRTVVYSCGAIAHAGDPVRHDHPTGELALCRRLATAANKVMEGESVGMGTEGSPINGTEYFSPFFITANQTARPLTKLTEKAVRSLFGGVIRPEARIWVEPLQERGEWWASVLHDAGGDEDSDCNEDQVEDYLKPWRKMIAWFSKQKDFLSTYFLMFGDGGDGGAAFPRIAVGLTRAGSLAGIIGHVVST